jgi:hypothetical protein
MSVAILIRWMGFPEPRQTICIVPVSALGFFAEERKITVKVKEN